MTLAAAPRRSWSRRRLASLALLVATAVAGPPGGAARADGPRPGSDCKCRANGTYYRMGERACIGTPNGPRTAECGMVQNVTSWKVTGEGCAEARLRPAGGAAGVVAASGG